MKLIGYVRTTITDQDPKMQLTRLKEFGCTEIFMELFNGHEPADSEVSVESVIAQMQPQEVLVTSDLQRLGKTTRQLAELCELFKLRSLHLVCLEDGLDTRDANGSRYLDLIIRLANMECSLIKERTLIGLRNARQKGKFGGRPKVDNKTIQKICHLYYDKKESIQNIAARCGVSVGTCYKYVKLMK